ncbi:MAG TPA: nuclear transport factor 2 family protein [Bdellovibrionota bacterium]|jgi:hypothetical protein|nr:nuclear transport factor 2 family protein [Bdellovibrionota bacterium]
MLLLLFGLLVAPVHAAENPAVKVVGETLDHFHQAASRADGKAYFDLFAPEGVFLGTDASERWTVEEFKKYAMPHFEKGKGWTYVPRNRHIDLAPGGKVAWFDELLDNKNYGVCRGSGVLRLIEGRWKVAQYHLTIPVPNELADTVVKMIAEKKK